MPIVVEIQNDGSNVSQITTVHSTTAEANQKYHEILAYAAVSNVAYHGAAMLNDVGDWMKSEHFDHPAETE